MTSPYLNRTPRSRLQAAYDVCPELRTAVETLQEIEGLGLNGPHLSAKDGMAAAIAVVGQARVIARAALATIQAMESEK